MHNITPPPIGNLARPLAAGNTMDAYKGTSFRYSQWAQMTHFFNNEYIIDFVGWDGCLWACTMSHLSSNANLPKDGSPYWSKVITGVEGKSYVPKLKDGKLVFELSDTTPEEIEIDRIKGDPGISYTPTKIENGKIYFRSSEGNEISIDASELKGEQGIPGKDGQTPQFIKNVVVHELDHGESASGKLVPVSLGEETAYRLELYIPEGPQGIQGLKGDKGDKGNPGKDAPIPSFNLKWKEDDIVFGGKSLRLECTINGTTTDLGEVGAKSPKLMRVLSTVDDPDSQDDTKHNDRILWGYDGVPVDEWATLCYLDELRGDQNIVIGCPNNLNNYYDEYDEFGGPADHDKIWFDTCDESIGEYSVSDLLYRAYLDIGGILSKEDFDKAFGNIGKESLITGFEIKFAKSFAELGDPSEEKAGILWFVDVSNETTNNQYEEYICVETPEHEYIWERWGTGSVNVDLTNYYTKQEIDVKIKELEDQIRDIKLNWTTL